GAEGVNYGFTHNGLYQQLAYLYAASGNTSMALRCIDTLGKYNQNYYQGDYSANGDNAASIAAVYFLNGQTNQIDAFVKGYCDRKKINGEEFYERLLGRTLHGFQGSGSLRLLVFMDESINLNLIYCTQDLLRFFFNKYRESVITEYTDKNQRNFLLA